MKIVVKELLQRLAHEGWCEFTTDITKSRFATVRWYVGGKIQTFKVI